MRNLFLAIVALIGFNLTANAQEVKTVKLEQTKGEFTEKGLTLAEGDYVFEITNTGIDKGVGFVLAPEEKTDQKHHIQNAYVSKLVEKNQTVKSKGTVHLKKGTYVYFCPLNPTPQYTLTVK